MGSIGTGEILLVFLIALLLFGPNKLPELGKALGRAIREFKKAEQDIKDVITKETSAGADPEDPSRDIYEKIKRSGPDSVPFNTQQTENKTNKDE
jgi:sec-independent protein translocase protein TatA